MSYAVRACALLMLSLLLALGTSACAFRRDEPHGVVTGAVGLSLTGVANGATYRLRNAEIVITPDAPQGEALVLSTESDPSAALLTAALDTGGYSANLQSGWVLELQETGDIVEASLTSANPRPFQILAGSTTRLVYEFEASGKVISIGSGTIIFSIDVRVPDAGTGTSGSGRDTCTVLPDNCGPGAVCGSFAGEDGAPFHQCIATCNPVTQERDIDHAPACGSPNPSAPTLGCYGPLTGPFTCAQAGSASNTHRQPAASASGAVFLNACAPGYLPLLLDQTGGSSVLCIALCAPAQTFRGNAANANGLPPHSCSDRGANGAECLFSWRLLSDPATAASATLLDSVGYCFDRAFYTIDDDRNASTPDVAVPSCTMLASTDTDADAVPDYLQFGCGPLAALPPFL